MGAPVDPGFGVDVAREVLDGLGRDEQLSGYLDVGQPLRDQGSNAGLPVGHLQYGAPFGVLLTQPAGAGSAAGAEDISQGGWLRLVPAGRARNGSCREEVCGRAPG